MADARGSPLRRSDRVIGTAAVVSVKLASSVDIRPMSMEPALNDGRTKVVRIVSSARARRTHLRPSSDAAVSAQARGYNLVQPNRPERMSKAAKLAISTTCGTKYCEATTLWWYPIK